MTNSDQYVEAASGARSATEKTAELWKQGAQRLTDQATAAAKLPPVDVTEAVERYFQYVQRAVELNREYALKSAAVVAAFSDGVREQIAAVSPILRAHAEAIAELVTKEAELAEQVVRQQSDALERGRQDQVRKGYQGLTRAELVDRLAQRELPKNGSVDELIDRLVAADR